MSEKTTTSLEGIKHIDTPEELAEVAKTLGVRDDWHEPDEQGLTLEYNGKLFDNAGIWGHKVAIVPDSLEQYVTIKKNDRPVAEVNMANLLAWASKASTKETIIRVSHESGTSLFPCMSEEEARKEIIGKIYLAAENMKDLGDVYELLDRFVDLDAPQLFMSASENADPNSVNPYDVLTDMDQDPDYVLYEVIENLAQHLDPCALMDVASTHFALSSDALIIDSIDRPGSEVPTESLLRLAKEMDIEIDPSMEAALNMDQSK